MKKIILVGILTVSIFNFSYSQEAEFKDDEVFLDRKETLQAISTSKKVLKFVKSQNTESIISLFEDKVKTMLKPDDATNAISGFLKIINNEEIDFNNYRVIQITHEIEGYDELYKFRFPMGNNVDHKDYFETIFLKDGNFEKIYSLNFIRALRMKEVNVTFGAEDEKIPTVGEVKVERYENTNFIESIKYRDFDYLVIIKFDERQNKVSESRFPLNELTFIHVTKFFSNGQIELIGSYRNGVVIGHFQTFYENGNTREEGTYIEGIKEDGYWKYYSEDGNLEKIVNFEFGKKK